MQIGLSLHEQLVIKFRALDDIRLTTKPDDPITLKLITESWLAMIRDYQASDLNIAKFAKVQFAELLADHNKASEVIKMARVAIEKAQEREVCKLIAELLPPKNHDQAHREGVDYKIEQYLSSHVTDDTYLRRKA